MNTSEPSPSARSATQRDTSPGEPPSPQSTAARSPLPFPFSAANNAPKIAQDRELQKQDSFAARVRAARRVPTLLRDNSSALPSAPAALFRWETRGHFWSELEKSPMDGNKAGGSALQRCGQAASRWCQAASVATKNVWTVVRRKPSIVVWPLLLLAVLLAVGIVGVTLGANDYEKRSQDNAIIAGAKAVNALQLVVERALQPLRSTEVVVQLQPAMAVLGPSLRRISARPLDQAPPVITSLFLSPFGLVRANVTPRYESAATAAAVAPPLGTLLMPGEPLRSAQLQDILLRVPDWLPPASRVVSSPNTTTSGGSAKDKDSPSTSALLVAHKPVLIINARPTDSWNNSSPCGALPPVDLDTDPSTLTSNPSVAGGHCLFVPGGTNPAAAAVDSSSSSSSSGVVNGTRLWGFVSGLVRVEDLVRQSASGLQQLRKFGYLWRLTIRAAPLPAAGAPVVATVSCDTPPAYGSVVLPVAVFDAVWQLELEKEGGHRPAWEAPLIAVVVVVSLALAALLFATLVIQQRHLVLLEAMLPKKVIKLLGTGRPFYQHYECVTVLYADIIRYSNAPTGMPPWEVVSLLNDVHNMYDSLMEKHGLIKIRRSGEAFMGVGGCPTAEDPVNAALRAALCAREMVLATASFRSSVGQRVQIRLGLHSGPVVAAVVGTHMPRFSLFGDTIDISHFMEATSSIMRVHVSDTTAELLNIADDPLVSLQPRGVIDVRGRGAITTSWLRLDLLSSVTSLGPSRQLTMMGGDRASRASAQPPSMQSPLGGDGGERDSWVPPWARGAGGDGRASVGGGGATAAAMAARGSQAGPLADGRGSNVGGSGGGGGGKGGGGGGERGARAGGPREARADIACAADLAVAAAMGVRGAPLVRKLSQTGLTQTRRALPDRRTQREGVEAAAAAAVERSLLGSFTLRLEAATMGIFRNLMATPMPPPVLVRAADDDGGDEEAGAAAGGYDLRDVAGWMSAPRPARKWQQEQQEEAPQKQEQGAQQQGEQERQTGQERVVVVMKEEDDGEDKAAPPPRAMAAGDAPAAAGTPFNAAVADEEASAPAAVAVTDIAATALDAAVACGEEHTPAHLATDSDAAASLLLAGEQGDLVGGSSGSSSRHAAVPSTGIVGDEAAVATADASRWVSTVGSGSSSTSRREAAAAGVQVAVAVGSGDGEAAGDAKREQR